MDRPVVEDGRHFVQLGAELARIRKLADGGRGLSQDKFAHLLASLVQQGPEQSEISKFELGKRRPSPELLSAYVELGGDRAKLEALDKIGYPERHGIDPVVKLVKEVADDGSSTPLMEEPPAEESSRPASKRRWPVALLVFGCSLVVALVAMLFNRAGPPHSVVGSEESIDILDKRGKVLWQEPTNPRQSPVLGSLIVDLNLDGRSEVLLSFDPEGPAQWNGYLQAHDGTGRELWRQPYGRPLDLEERLIEQYPLPPFFVSHHLAAVPSRAPRYILQVVRHEKWWPSQTLLRDPSDGRIVSEYWHPGYVDSYATIDVDGDGEDELLIGGVNNPGNGRGRPYLAVFEVPFAPSKRADAIFGFCHSAPKVYLLFPRVDLHRAKRKMASVSSIDRQLDRIEVKVEAQLADTVFYHFTLGLDLLQVVPASNFRGEHDRLLGHDHQYDPQEAESQYSKIERFPVAPNGNRPSEELFAASQPPCDVDGGGSTGL